MAKTEKIPILLVDDRAENLIALKGLLEDLGLDISTALSGNEALRLTLKHDFAIVLMDIRMPDMDGYETAELMRANPKTRNLPIIFVTAASTDASHQFKGYEAGAVDYLLKPIEPTIMRSKVRVFCDLYRQRWEIELREQQLESRIKERTAELRDANEHLQKELAERKQAEEALRTSQTFNKNILESVGEGFIVVDRQYRILSANKAFCDSVAMNEANIINRFCYEVSHHVNKPCFDVGEECAVKRTFETGMPHNATHAHTTDASGAKRFVEIRSYPITDPWGKVVSAIETITDITEKRKLEDQLRQAQKMEAIGTLAGGVAHDFNNILTAIIGYATIVKMKMEAGDPQRAVIDQLLASSDRAAQLTQGLLAFSRKHVLDPRPIDLNDMVKSVEKLLVRLIGEDVELSTLLEEQSLIAMADAGQVEQVLMNLATNARDAMPEGGLLTMTTQAFDLTGEFVALHGFGTPGKYALITVSDTGIGMDERTREKIFEPFFTTKELGKGTGLGLAIVYGIIKQHDGTINVYSEPGKGTTFNIYLPLITSKIEKAPVLATAPPCGGTETILFAEDDQEVRTLTTTILRDFGYSVIDAFDGQDALDKIAEHTGMIDLFILDVIMPRKSGKEVYEAIRPAHPDIDVLFVSGYTADIIRKKGIVEEGTQFMSKPVSPFELLRKIREMLDKTRTKSVSRGDGC